MQFVDIDDKPADDGLFNFKERGARPATAQEYDMWKVLVDQAAEAQRLSGTTNKELGDTFKSAYEMRDSLGHVKSNGPEQSPDGANA